jgi:hypothetical protein
MNKYRREEDSELFKIAGNCYYIDLNELSNFIRIEKTESVDDILGEAKKELEENQESLQNEETYAQLIDITKWETTKVLIESILTEQGPVDEAMGVKKLEDQLSIPFKLSFNTLLKYKIIKEDGR